LLDADFSHGLTFKSQHTSVRSASVDPNLKERHGFFLGAGNAFAVDNCAAKRVFTKRGRGGDFDYVSHECQLRCGGLGLSTEMNVSSACCLELTKAAPVNPHSQLNRRRCEADSSKSLVYFSTFRVFG
jgi:hypothetical protein